MNPLRSTLFLAAFACATLSTSASADTLSGRVVDTGGAGVLGVNIDLEDMITGDKPVILNGGTDANGDFLLTAPAGLYRVIFIPPPPPGTTHLVTTVENISVVGAAAMGTTELLPGVSLSGRLVTSGGVPIPGIDLDFFDPGTGDELVIPGDNSGAVGDFLVAVPNGALELEVRPSEGSSPLYAAQQIELNLAGNTALGDLVVEAGFFLSGTAQRTGGMAIAGANADVVNALTGDKLFTPGDGSDVSGFMEVVVPAGTFDLEVCPPSGAALVGQTVVDIVVAADTSAGLITLVDGVVLSGQLFSSTGAPVVGGDIDVRDASTQVAVLTCNDDTDASGNFSVMVPNGVFDVTFSVPADPSVGSATVPDVAVAGATSVDGKLPGCPCSRYCVANVNSSGQAACMIANGSNVVSDQTFQLVTQNLPGSVPGLYFFGPNQIQSAFGDGIRCVGGATKRIQPPAFAMMGVAQRTLDFGLPVVADNIVMGSSLNFQLWYRDTTGGPAGFNLSDGLNVVWQ